MQPNRGVAAVPFSSGRGREERARRGRGGSQGVSPLGTSRAPGEGEDSEAEGGAAAHVLAHAAAPPLAGGKGEEGPFSSGRSSGNSTQEGRERRERREGRTRERQVSAAS